MFELDSANPFDYAMLQFHAVNDTVLQNPKFMLIDRIWLVSTSTISSGQTPGTPLDDMNNGETLDFMLSSNFMVTGLISRMPGSDKCAIEFGRHTPFQNRKEKIETTRLLAKAIHSARKDLQCKSENRMYFKNRLASDTHMILKDRWLLVAKGRHPISDLLGARVAFISLSKQFASTRGFVWHDANQFQFEIDDSQADDQQLPKILAALENDILEYLEEPYSESEFAFQSNSKSTPSMENKE